MASSVFGGINKKKHACLICFFFKKMAGETILFLALAVLKRRDGKNVYILILTSE